MHLAVFVWRMKYLWLHTFIGKYSYLTKWPWNSPWKSTATIAVSWPDNKQNCCGTREEYECVELRLRRSLRLASGVMGFARSSLSESAVTLYVGLQHAVPPININSSITSPDSSGIPYTNTHKHRTSYFKSTHISGFPLTDKNGKFLRFLHHNNK